MAMTFKDYVKEVAYAIVHLNPKYPQETYFQLRELRYTWKCHLGLHYWRKGLYSDWRVRADGYNEPLEDGWHCESYCHERVPYGKFPYAPIRWRIFWKFYDVPYSLWWDIKEWVAEKNTEKRSRDS